MRDMVRIMMIGTIPQNANPRKWVAPSWEIPLSLICRHFPALSGISLPDHFTIRQYTPGSTGVMESL